MYGLVYIDKRDANMDAESCIRKRDANMGAEGCIRKREFIHGYNI